MDASYAFPLRTNDPVTNNHEHNDHGRTRSHHRKAAPDRLPFSSVSINGTLNANAAYPQDPAPNVDSPLHSYSLSLPQVVLSERKPSHRPLHSISPPMTSALSPSHVMSNTIGSLDQTHQRSEPHRSQQQSTQGDHAVAIHKPGFLQYNRERYPDPSVTTKEFISSILILLPFALTGYFLNAQVPNAPTLLSEFNHSGADHVPREETIASILSSQSNLFAICTLTSLTLFFLGLIAKIRGTAGGADRRKTSLTSLSRGGGKIKLQDGSSTLDAIRAVIEKVLAVALPLYAATLLGGERVGMLMLLMAAGEVAGQWSDLRQTGNWKRSLAHRKWTIAVLILQVIVDSAGVTSDFNPRKTMLGYLAFGFAYFVPQAYLADVARRPRKSTNVYSSSTPFKSATSLEPSSTRKSPATIPSKQSMINLVTKEANLSIISGTVLALVLSVVRFISKSQQISSSSQLSWLFITLPTITVSLAFSDPMDMRTKRKVGLAVGLTITLLCQLVLRANSVAALSCQAGLVGCFWTALRFDTHTSFVKPSTSNHHQRGDPSPQHKHGSNSDFTAMLLVATRDWPLLNSILIEKDSRRILYFMSLNFGFMLVQTFYAIVTGSLGLLSDSIHMLFDCLALVVGLCAAVMSKRPPSIRFPYGFGKMDTLAGFANGVFLMLISIEIIYEAVERLVEGSRMQRIGELLTVSSLGLVVNLVGMFAFGHAHHGHGHDHGHSHGHSHSAHINGDHNHAHNHHNHSHAGDSCSHPAHDNEHDAHSHSHASRSQHEHKHNNHGHTHAVQSPLPFTIPPNSSQPPPSNAHSHSHHHGNENMHGIFLHILADTLGSVAVVISTILIHYTGWAGFDPLASCLIAILIFASAIPLVISSAKRLLLTVPEDTEFDLREALAGVSSLRGVSAVCVPRFWMGEGGSGRVGGVMHVLAQRGVDLDSIREKASGYLASRGMDVLVQVEREGEGRCWCGGGVKNG